jgi:hypothetical protein
MPVFTAIDPAITIGGKSSPYVDWSPSAANPMSGFDTVSVSTNDGYRFYKQGQIVRHLEKFYSGTIASWTNIAFIFAFYALLITHL